MARRHKLLAAAGLIFWVIATGRAGETIRLSPHVTVYRDAVNGVCIEKDGRRLVVYGDPAGHLTQADRVLFTHGRRDVAEAGRRLVAAGAQAIVPAGEVEQFTKVEAFWEAFTKKRFHDYQQQGTKLLTESMQVDRKIKEGDTLRWREMPIKVMATPGYTRGAVSYFMDIDGRKIGFVGDLIYGKGRLFDLYSLQDEVKEANIWGYHGWAGRMGDLIASLRKVLGEKPDVLVPARGPVIEDPPAAITQLIRRLQAVYHNYLSINAGHWYFKAPYEILAARVLGEEAKVNWMAFAEVIEKKPPDWIVPIQNSRLILAQDKSGFLVDCGSQGILNKVVQLHDEGRMSQLDGLFITHYHDDHTHEVNALVRRFGCPVYACEPLGDILKHPQAYRLPAMTERPFDSLTIVPEGHRITWKEFTLTFYDFPGQTLYHDAMLAEKENGERIFFIGDSFTPSGIDDYCLLNRNLLHPGEGYFYCLDFLQKMRGDYLLINEHVLETFRFGPKQLEEMVAALWKRQRLLASLFPWDEPNYGIDERWARLYPYGQTIRAGGKAEITVKILNHSDRKHRYTVRPQVPEGFQITPSIASREIASRTEAGLRFQITAPPRPARRVNVVTCDIEFDTWSLPQWCEGLLEIEKKE